MQPVPTSLAIEQEVMQLALPFEGVAPVARVGLRSIETDFPVAEVSRLTKIESYRKNIYRAAYYIHKWWARRAGTAFRAILLGTLLPEGNSPMDFFYRANSFDQVIILDPFMGGGTTVGEALRLGTRVIGIDVNPVSWFLVKKIVEPVSIGALDAAFRHLEMTVGQEIQRLYETRCPQCGGKAQAIYTYWASLVPCRACGSMVPLRKSMTLAPHMSKPHTGLVTCPRCAHPYISSTLDRAQCCPICGVTFDARQGFSRGASYTCPVCGTTDRIVHALHGQDAPPSRAMVAICFYCDVCGKGYKRPDAQDVESFECIKERLEEQREHLLYPRAAIPSGYNTNQMLNYNYRFWFQLFNERQLVGLSMLLEAIRGIEDPNVMEFLLLLFSGILEFNNMFCSSKGLGTGAVRHIFAHHAFIPAKEPLEANLWGVARSSGGFSTLYWERLRRGKIYAHCPVERRLVGNRVVQVALPGECIEARLAQSLDDLIASPDRRVLLLNRSSVDLTEIPDRVVDAVVTDPPYLDNVMYSELSDFFYVWLKLVLEGRYSQFAGPSASRADEAIRNVEQGKDTRFYTHTLAAVFKECHRVLKDEGLLVFTFHHGTAEAWDALARSLDEANFSIRRIWPVHAEMDVGVPILGKQSIKYDAILVCRKREEMVSPVTDISSALIERIEQETRSLEMLIGAAALSEADRRSLSLAVAAMLYTRRQTRLLPSEWEGAWSRNRLR